MRDVQDELNRHSDDEVLVHGTRESHQGSDGPPKNVGTDKVTAEATSIANEMRKGSAVH